MASTLNIAALARRTGVAPDTLRKWEQRYGVLRPERTPGGQRRYSERDVARVEWLRDRISEGYRIGVASRLLGGVEAEPALRPEQLPELLYDALRDLDPDRLASLLDQTFALLSLERALVDVIAPLLERIGDAWEAGDISVAQEHLLSARVRGRLAHLLADGGGSVRGTAVLACAPGERHELGLLMLGVLLRADGWHVEALGADTPVAQASALAEALGAGVLCVSATSADTARRLRDEAEAVERRVPLVLGGDGIDGSLAAAIDAEHVDDELAGAVERLRAFAG